MGIGEGGLIKGFYFIYNIKMRRNGVFIDTRYYVTFVGCGCFYFLGNSFSFHLRSKPNTIWTIAL